MTSQGDSQPAADQGNSADNAAQSGSELVEAQETSSSHPAQSGSAPVEAQDTLPLPEAEIAGPKVADPEDTRGSQTTQSQPLDAAESQHLRFKAPMVEQRRLTDTFDEESMPILKETEALTKRNTDEQTPSTSINPVRTGADFQGTDEGIIIIRRIRRNLDGLAEDDPSRRSIEAQLSQVLENPPRLAVDYPDQGGMNLEWTPRWTDEEVLTIVRSLDIRAAREARRARERRGDRCWCMSRCFCLLHYFKWLICLFY